MYNYVVVIASSEEEEDELVFSDELAERGGSDTDSMENLDPVSVCMCV